MKNLIFRYRYKITNTQNPFIKLVLNHTPKYLSASAFSAIVGMLMTKYYTQVFEPAEFGVLSLYILLFQYMQNLIAFTIDSSAQRVYFDYDDKEKKQFLGTVLIFMMISALFWVFVSLLFKDIFIFWFGGNNLIFIVTIISTVLWAFVNFFNRISYNLYLSKLVFSQTTLQTILNHGMSFILISFCYMGVLGRQLGQGIAFAINLLFYRRSLKELGYLVAEYTLRFDILKRIFYFSFPALCTTVLLATFSYLDRVFLKYYHGNSEVGIYSLGVIVGQGMSLVVEAVSLAVFPSLMKQLKINYEDGIKKIKKFDLIFCSILIIISIILFFLRDIIVLILSNPKYLQAGLVMPFIIFSYVMNGFYKNVSSVLSFHNVVWIFPILSTVSFGLSAIANYLLIPRFHEIGAAYSNFIGMFFYSFTIHIAGSKYYFKKKNILLVYFIAFVIVTYLFYSII